MAVWKIMKCTETKASLLANCKLGFHTSWIEHKLNTSTAQNLLVEYP